MNFKMLWMVQMLPHRSSDLWIYPFSTSISPLKDRLVDPNGFEAAESYQNFAPIIVSLLEPNLPLVDSSELT